MLVNSRNVKHELSCNVTLLQPTMVHFTVLCVVTCSAGTLHCFVCGYLLCCPPHSLRVLHLNGNQLTILPDHVAKLKFLSVLTLSFNEFDALPDVLRRVSLLKVLNMAGNFLK